MKQAISNKGWKVTNVISGNFGHSLITIQRDGEIKYATINNDDSIKVILKKLHIK